MGRTVTSVSVDLEAKTASFKDELKKASRSIKAFEKQGKASFKGAGKSARGFKVTVDQVTNSLGPLKAAFAGLTAALGFSELVQANTEYQKLNASLVTVTGSAENADTAFKAIQQFATETPYQLNQVVEGFIKLQAMGLEPSQRALESYGNTASAMGKSLNQMIEAVADAATGEFERLKEFGIKASSEGDRVAFTFRGITTEIGKNADEIQQYLLSLGESEFAGAMEMQMNTLGGVFSNLEDSLFNLAVAIGEAGLNDLVMEFTKSINAAAQAVTGFVQNPASMPDWLKNLSYWLKGTILEIQDLGNWLGSVAAITQKVIELDFKAVERIVAQRKQARAEMEAELADFAVTLQDELVPKIQEAYGKMFEDPLANMGGEVSAARKLTPVMSDEEFEVEFARAEEQFSKLNALYEKKAADQAKIEKKYGDMIVSMKMSVASQALGFVKMLANENEAVQKLVLLAEKGLAIAQTKINTEVAAMRALAELGPIYGAPVAAKIRTLGAISMGIIAATGIAQAAGIGGAGGSGIGGVPAIDTAAGAPVPPPTFTDTAATEEGGTVGTVTINVNGVITDEILEDLMIPAIQDAVNDRDVILIRGDSRQALELG